MITTTTTTTNNNNNNTASIIIAILLLISIECFVEPRQRIVISSGQTGSPKCRDSPQ